MNFIGGQVPQIALDKTIQFYWMLSIRPGRDAGKLDVRSVQRVTRPFSFGDRIGCIGADFELRIGWRF